jgi:hypothetical protein
MCHGISSSDIEKFKEKTHTYLPEDSRMPRQSTNQVFRSVYTNFLQAAISSSSLSRKSLVKSTLFKSRHP